MSEKPYANGKSFANGKKVGPGHKAEANVHRLGLADSVRYHGTRAVSAPDVVRYILEREAAGKSGEREG
jgi:hypothetical protein